MRISWAVPYSRFTAIVPIWKGLKAALTERTGTFMKEYLAAHIEKKIISGAWAGRSCVLPERSLSCFSCIFSDAAVTSIPLQDLYSKESSREVAKFISDTLQLYHGAGGTAASAYDNLHNGNRINSGDLLLPHSGGRAYDAAGNSLRCLSGRNEGEKQ